MALKWYTLVVDCADPQAQAHWWAEALDWQVVYDTPDEAVAIPKGMSEDPVDDVEEWMARGQGLVFVPVPEGKTVKNRVHLDVRPADGDADALRASVLDRGATQIGAGRQGPHAWVVFTDPEGNEFCIT